MFKLIFNNDKKAHKRLVKVQKKIDKFSRTHKDSLSEREHKQLRRHLKKRADALSKSTGMKIHSMFD